MYVQPVRLSPNTSPWASASGSTATVAIGQIAAMKVVTSMLTAEVLRRRDVADQQQHRDHPEHVPLQRGVAVRRRAQQHQRDAAERDERERERARVDVLAEQPGADRHDQERRERPDQRGVGDAVVRRPGEEHGQVQAEEDARHEHLAHVAARDPPARAPQHGVPEQADGDHPPERDEHARRLRALHERRAQRERHDEPDDRQHPERLRAQRTLPRRRLGHGRTLSRLGSALPEQVAARGD